MSSEPSKVSGAFTKAMGAVKETTGKVVGSDDMQARGAAQKAEGMAETQTAKAQGHAEGTKDSLKGSVKDTAGGLMGDSQMRAEGKGDKALGESKKATNA